MTVDTKQQFEIKKKWRGVPKRADTAFFSEAKTNDARVYFIKVQKANSV